MWRKSKPELLKSNGLYHITLKILKKLPNGKTVDIREIFSKGRRYVVTKHTTSNSTFALGSIDEDVNLSTFVRYERDDGKIEETRLDKLLKVSKSHDFNSFCHFVGWSSSEGGYLFPGENLNSIHIVKGWY